MNFYSNTESIVLNMNHVVLIKEDETEKTFSADLVGVSQNNRLTSASSALPLSVSLFTNACRQVIV